MATSLPIKVRALPELSAVVEVVLPVTARQESINDEIGDFATQPLAGGLVEPEMLSPKNPAERRLVGGVAEGAERTLHPGQHLGSDAELEGITPEESREHARCGCADDAVGARVGGIRAGLADLGKPIWTRARPGVIVRIRSADRSDGPPEVVGVLRIVEGDPPVREREVQQREQAGGLRRRGAGGGGGR